MNTKEKRGDVKKQRSYAEGRVAGLMEAMELVPNNWLDPLLSGPAALASKWDGPSVEALAGSRPPRLIRCHAFVAETLPIWPSDLCATCRARADAHAFGPPNPNHEARQSDRSADNTPYVKDDLA